MDYIMSEFGTELKMQEMEGRLARECMLHSYFGEIAS